MFQKVLLVLSGFIGGATLAVAITLHVVTPAPVVIVRAPAVVFGATAADRVKPAAVKISAPIVFDWEQARQAKR